MAHFDPFRPPNQPIKGFDPYDRTPKWPVLTPFRPHFNVYIRNLGFRDPIWDPKSRDPTPKYDHLDPKLDHLDPTLNTVVRNGEIERPQIRWLDPKSGDLDLQSGGLDL